MISTIITILFHPLIILSIIILPGFLIAAGLAKMSGALQKGLIRLIGVRGYLFFFGWLGTMVHELSHAGMCILFRHKIHKVKLFRTNPFNDSGGYVSHSFDCYSRIQRLGGTFISIPPIFGGALVSMFAAMLLMPGLFDGIGYWPLSIRSAIFILVFTPIQTLLSLFSWHNWVNFKFYVFLYVLISVGGGLKLSKTDISNAIKGAGPLFLLTYCVLITLSLLDRGFDLQLSHWFLSAASTGYSLLITAIIPKFPVYCNEAGGSTPNLA